jgi:2,4-dienoyl-CoA reductase-like NADH-dependent reductase (Old Yellow Enzyme family)
MDTERRPPVRQVFTPSAIGGLRLRNRFVRSAAFEGMCPQGEPTDALVDYHRRLAAGGVGMTTVAYAAVSELGRSYPHQLALEAPGTPAGLRRLTDAVHAEGAAASLQLAHAGYAGDPQVAGGRTIGPSRVLNRYKFAYPRPMTEDDVERAAGEYARAAAAAVEAGFDAVEVHAGHGYLLSQFLSPHTNRRTDAFGGSPEGRLRFPLEVVRRVREAVAAFPLEVVRRVREAVAARVPVLVKMNLRDGFSGGLEIDEAVEIARGFEAAGVDALVLSGGFMTRTPIYIMRGDVPLAELRRELPRLASRIGSLLIGRFMLPAVPFSEAYFLEDARRVREAVHVPLVLVGGLRTLDRMDAIVREGFDFLAMARPFVLEPDLVSKFERGEVTEARCVPCNKCLASVARGQLRCLRF